MLEDLGQTGEPVDGGEGKRGVPRRAGAGPGPGLGDSGRHRSTRHDPVDVVDERVEVRGAAVSGARHFVDQLGAETPRVGAQDQDAVGEEYRLLDVVGHHDHRAGREPVSLPQLEELAAQVLGCEHVQRTEGLVHEQHVRLEDQGPGEPDPLAHTARQLLGERGLVAVETHQVDGPQRLLGPFAYRHPPCLETDLDVLLDTEPGKEGEGLEHHGRASVASHESSAPIEHLTRRRRDQSGHAAQQGRLPASAASQQGDEFRVGHLQVDALEHRDGLVSGARKGLGDVTDRDEALGVTHANVYLVSASR